MAVVPKNAYSSYDQLKGKAERRAKKMLYEYVTGLDLGEYDGDSDNDTGRRRVEDAEVVQQNEPAPNQPEPGEPEKMQI